MHILRSAPLLAPLFLAAPAFALQSFALTVAPGQSSVSLASTFRVELPGSAIGDFHPDSNPGGTRTLPGLFGGDGNQPIPMDIGVRGDTAFAGPPLGSFVLEADPTALTLEVRELELELFGGGAATTTLTLSLLFNTFRTFSPTSLFIGGFPLDLPLGEQSLTDLQVVQSGPSTAGVLVPGGAPGEYQFAVLVPAELSFSVEVLGQSFPVGPLPALLPLAGALFIAGDAALASVTFDIAVDQAIDDPLPGFSIDDLPFDLPTILPPGEIAHLLLSFVIASIEVAAGASLDLVAEGLAPCGFERYCLANQNSTGAPARLDVFGSPDAAAGELQFVASDLPTFQVGFFIMSQGEAFLPGHGGHQGNLCLGPRQIRFAHDVLHFGREGVAHFSPDFDNLPQGVVFQPGSTWRFQLWYRDLNPDFVWNSSDAVRVRFCAQP